MSDKSLEIIKTAAIKVVRTLNEYRAAEELYLTDNRVDTGLPFEQSETAKREFYDLVIYDPCTVYLVAFGRDIYCLTTVSPPEYVYVNFGLNLSGELDKIYPAPSNKFKEYHQFLSFKAIISDSE